MLLQGCWEYEWSYLPVSYVFQEKFGVEGVFFPWLILVERYGAFSVNDKCSWRNRCYRAWGDQFSDVLIVLFFLHSSYSQFRF